MMRISELKPKSSVEKIELVIVEKEDSRGFISRLGVKGKVCNAVAKDDSGGRIGLTLWNDEIDRVDINDKVCITNGWVKEWDGNLEISAGKFGRLDVLK
jgi:replication factor A1